MSTPLAPFLVALPGGLVPGGVQVWAVRLLNALAAQGRATGLILHASTAAHAAPLAAALHPGVRVFDLSHLPPLENANGDISAYVPEYRRAITSLHERAAVVCCPTLLGDCAGVFAAVAQTDPHLLRVVAWRHSAIPYDGRVIAHYEPLFAALAGVSEYLREDLRTSMPHRAAGIVAIPNGVEPADAPAARTGDGPLRIIYTGRIEDDLKRVGVLPLLSDELDARGIDHEITIIGDGPAAATIDAAAAQRLDVRRLGALPPDRIASALDHADVFVLPSRVEGLSLSMLEAMARGCVPVVTRTPSGASEVIRHGENGLLVDPDGSHADVAAALANAIAFISPRTLSRLSRAAWTTVRDRYSLAAMVENAGAFIDAAAASPARAWPRDRAAAFTAADGATGSGAVPSNGARRLHAVLESLRGRRILVHGVGRHTLELRAVFEPHMESIAAFVDDDPSRHGQSLWGRPILSPSAAAALGATDVVISSWMNQDLIWSSRAVYERLGLGVHRLYAAAA